MIEIVVQGVQVVTDVAIAATKIGHRREEAAKAVDVLLMKLTVTTIQIITIVREFIQINLHKGMSLI